MTDDEKFADLRHRAAALHLDLYSQFPIYWSDDKGVTIHEMPRPVPIDQKLLDKVWRKWERDVCRVSFDSYARMLRRDYGRKRAERFIIKDLVRKWRKRDNVVQNGQQMIIDNLKWQSKILQSTRSLEKAIEFTSPMRNGRTQ